MEQMRQAVVISSIKIRVFSLSLFFSSLPSLAFWVLHYSLRNGGTVAMAPRWAKKNIQQCFFFFPSPQISSLIRRH